MTCCSGHDAASRRPVNGCRLQVVCARTRRAKDYVADRGSASLPPQNELGCLQFLTIPAPNCSVNIDKPCQRCYVSVQADGSERGHPQPLKPFTPPLKWFEWQWVRPCEWQMQRPTGREFSVRLLCAFCTTPWLPFLLVIRASRLLIQCRRKKLGRALWWIVVAAHLWTAPLALFGLVCPLAFPVHSPTLPLAIRIYCQCRRKTLGRAFW